MRRRGLLSAATALCIARTAAQTPAPAWTAAFEPEPPPHLLLRDGTGTMWRRLRAASLDGRSMATRAEVHTCIPRRSLVVAFGGLAEIWELPTDPHAPPLFNGLVHDYRLGEAVAEPGFLNPRRTLLERPLRALALDGERGFVLGREDAVPGSSGVRVVVLQLDIRRVLRRIELAHDVDTATALVAQHAGRRVFEIARRDGQGVEIVDAQ